MTDFTTKSSGVKEARERIRRCLDDFDMGLDLADLGLEQIPLDLRKLSHISALDLSDNKIKTLPAFLSEFTMLEYLDLSRNHFTTLPEAIGSLGALKVLNLRGNELSSLPESIDRLSQLEQLDCSRNKLTAVPETLGKLPALKNLNVSRNNLKTLPEAVRKLSGPGELSLSQHIEKLVELSREMGLHEDFFDHAKDHIKVVSRFFHLSAMQTALYSHFLVRYEDQHITTMDLSSSLNCDSNLGILPCLPEFDELEKKKLLYCRRDDGSLSFRVPEGVVEAIRKGEAYKPAHYERVSIQEFFEALSELFCRRGNNELSWDALASDIHTLLEDNPQLVFSQKALAYELDMDSEILLLYFCHLFGNQDNDRIWLSPMDNEVYDQKHKTLFRQTRLQFEEGTHVLMRMNLIEKRAAEEENDDFFGDREAFRLTDKAKIELLEELQLKPRKVKTDLITASNITQKALFFNERETAQIKRLTTLLQGDNYQAVRTRLAETGQRGGIVCLFSGAPGTGKTETVYQLARETGRDLLMMNIAEMRSKWVGESEKLTKSLFDKYRDAVKNCALTPILLFNEADAILSKRFSLNEDSHSVDQMSNTVQSILLQEMENLNGILIATTNMSLNMDKAFERRFLFKIEFGKPDLNTRRAIWRSMIPELAEEAVDTLSSRFDFSGGQIENITRRRTIEYITSGVEPSAEQLATFCEEESPEQEARRFVL
jgi:SpoVK/Ycf46/Vps4 family AAA+-type ATPase